MIKHEWTYFCFSTQCLPVVDSQRHKRGLHPGPGVQHHVHSPGGGLHPEGPRGSQPARGALRPRGRWVPCLCFLSTVPLLVQWNCTTLLPGVSGVFVPSTNSIERRYFDKHILYLAPPATLGHLVAKWKTDCPRSVWKCDEKSSL